MGRREQDMKLYWQKKMWVSQADDLALAGNTIPD